MEEDKLSPLVKVVTGVILFGITIGTIAWSASGSNSAQAGLIVSHDKRIADAEGEIKSLDKRLDNTEKMQISLAKDQEALLHGQREMKEQQMKFADLQIQQIKANAELHAYIKTIEVIE
jgi:hypothetical protein